MSPVLAYSKGQENEQIAICLDSRGGMYITGATSLQIHPASGTTIRVLTGAEEIHLNGWTGRPDDKS